MASQATGTQTAKRYQEIISVLNRNGLGFLFVRAALSPNPTKTLEKIDSKEHGLSIGERLCNSCEELGPTFVKIGQILSTRTDIIPESIARDLTRLQDMVSPFPFDEAKAEIEAQLQDTIAEVFEDFNTEPIASASISQVYSAHMHGGAHVAVKVQRPGITENVKTDLTVLAQLAAFLDKHTKYGRLYNFTGMVDELRKAMEQELDFTVEAEHVHRFRKQVGTNTDITAPKVYWIYTTPKILTMDFVEGIKINDIKALNAVGADKPKLANTFVTSLVDQILVDGFFHADPHPGNVMVVNEGRHIEFIDLGMVGELTPRFRRQLANFVLGLATGNMRQIAQSLMSMDMSGNNINQYHFTKALEKVLDKYLYGPMTEINIAEVFGNIFEMAADFEMEIPRDMTLVGKCLGTAQGTVEALDPSLSILQIAERTARTLIFKHLTSSDFRKDVISTGLDLADLAKITPGFLLSLMRKAEDNDFAVQIQVEHMTELEQSLERMANRVSFTVVLLAISLIMASIIVGIAFSSPELGEALFALDVVALVIGLALAAIIVFGLIFSMIHASRKQKKSK